jgi:glycosyltransferase involved in cell wall biosynthesis
VKIFEVTNSDFALVHFIAPLMRALRVRGHEVAGVAPTGPLSADLEAEGFRLIDAPLVRRIAPLAHLRAFRALLDLFRRERPELVHAHMPISGWVGRFAARAAGVPRIAYTAHGLLFLQPGPLWRRVVAFVLEWIAGQMTDLYLTVSEEEAAIVRRLRIHRGAVAVGNGRDPARFAPDPEARRAVREALGVPETRPVVIIVSRLVRHKGHVELLQAMESVPEAELWVVGERLPSDHGEDLEPHFARAAARLGPRLRRLGYRRDIPALLAAADIFVLPSHFEGLPMSVIEAMLCALPVVASSIRGPREQVIDGVTGLLVPPRDAKALAAALGRFVASPALRRQMGEAGRARALERYTEAAVLARTLDALGLAR